MFDLALGTWVTNVATGIILQLGYPGIFILMLLEGLLLPIPSEVVMAFGGILVYHNSLPPELGIPAFVLLVIVGSVGNMVGAYLAYLLGDYGGIPLILRYGKYVLLDKEFIDSTQKWFDRYGSPSVFLTRLVPIFRTFISIPAGIARMNRTHFLLLTLAGALIWDTMLVYLGYHIGSNLGSIENFFNKFTDVALVALAALVIWYVWRKLSQRAKIKN